MSIEIYKQLNQELIEKVQELKSNISYLDKQLAQVNSNFFDEHEKRINQKVKFLCIIKDLRVNFINDFNEALKEIEEEEVDDNVEVSTELTSSEQRQRLSLAEIRRSSFGVTSRSPVKSPQQQYNANAEQQYEYPVIAEHTNEEILSDMESETCQTFRTYSSSNVAENGEYVESFNNSKLKENSRGSTDTLVEEISHITPKRTPLIQLENRREAQLWNILRSSNDNTACEDTSKLSLAISDENNIERLTIQFSENIVLHSTARSCESLTSTVNCANEENSSSNSSRPRRRCAPTKLMEPSLMGKLRASPTTSKRNKKKR